MLVPALSLLDLSAEVNPFGLFSIILIIFMYSSVVASTLVLFYYSLEGLTWYSFLES